ncbi:hypothetical protein BDR04DRAFT_1130431 [Suillus decipiens]|nr:hypothetical protein BDR04DRAFT_1130431 [Suillus decipiens]
MTAQANNNADKTWVCGDEHRLKKKGVGQGIQQSDVICSTVSYLTEALDSLEYGKNHEECWTGKHFIKQLRTKIIPAFEHAHGAGYQALFLIDNSQGHSAYMNVNPGGKQAHMHDGWYDHDGRTVSQSMVYPSDHPQFPNQPKGIKAVLIEHGLYKSGCHGRCEKCNPDVDVACCNKCVLERQPDFQQQKSLVQETIEQSGHMCIFLPKFHCKLNLIEFFWGQVKKYLCDNCDYTFDTLKKNMPLALASVSINTIQLWQH